MKIEKTLIGFILLFVSCSSFNKPKKPTAQEIYLSGKVDNFDDFTQQDFNINSIDSVLSIYYLNHDSLIEKYVYNVDTNLKIFKIYDKSTLGGEKKFRNYIFMYKGKREGRCDVYRLDGTYRMTLWYKNDTLYREDPYGGSVPE